MSTFQGSVSSVRLPTAACCASSNCASIQSTSAGPVSGLSDSPGSGRSDGSRSHSCDSCSSSSPGTTSTATGPFPATRCASHSARWRLSSSQARVPNSRSDPCIEVAAFSHSFTSAAQAAQSRLE